MFKYFHLWVRKVLQLWLRVQRLLRKVPIVSKHLHSWGICLWWRTKRLSESMQWVATRPWYANKLYNILYVLSFIPLISFHINQFYFHFLVEFQPWNIGSKLAAVLVSLGVPTFVLIVVIGFALLKKMKKTQNQVTNDLVWKDNSLYDSNESLDFLKVPSKLPDWLKDRSEMIFSLDLISMGIQLGKGQFGTVFKGNLKQGNAMQVPDNEIIN